MLPVGRAFELIDRAVFKYGVRQASEIITQTHEQARVLKLNHGRSASSVVPNFAVIPERTWVKSTRFTVLWIANFKPLKRPELFIRLARDLDDQNVSFKMIGRRSEGTWCDSVLESAAQIRNLEYLGNSKQMP